MAPTELEQALDFETDDTIELLLGIDVLDYLEDERAKEEARRHMVAERDREEYARRHPSRVRHGHGSAAAGGDGERKPRRKPTEEEIEAYRARKRARDRARAKKQQREMEEQARFQAQELSRQATNPQAMDSSTPQERVSARGAQPQAISASRRTVTASGARGTRLHLESTAGKTGEQSASDTWSDERRAKTSQKAQRPEKGSARPKGRAVSRQDQLRAAFGVSAPSAPGQTPKTAAAAVFFSAVTVI